MWIKAGNNNGTENQTWKGQIPHFIDNKTESQSGKWHALNYPANLNQRLTCKPGLMFAGSHPIHEPVHKCFDDTGHKILGALTLSEYVLLLFPFLLAFPPGKLPLWLFLAEMKFLCGKRAWTRRRVATSFSLYIPVCCFDLCVCVLLLL